MAGSAPMAGAAGATEVDPMLPVEPVGCAEDEFDDGSSCQKLTVCGADEFEQSPAKPDQDRVCAKATQCGDDEYEKTPPMAGADRECSPVTVCGAGTFVSTEAAAQVDRACSPCEAGMFSSVLNAEACEPWAQCTSGETESVPPSATSDRVCSTCGAGKYEANGQCQTLTVCSSKEYEVTPATAVSDRECETLTACQPGSKQTAAPTATTDRQCGACSSGTFSTQVNAGECSVWTKCGVTEYESVSPSAVRDRACTSLTTCAAGTRIKTVSTSTSDRVCEACSSGTFTAAANLSSCQAWSNCVAGTWATAGSSSKDRTCTACEAGKFSTTQNATSCKAWTVCSANQNQTMAGSATSDVVCVDKPVCGTAKDRACTTECPCPSAEGVCTAGNQCVAGASCVAGSGKKVGRTGNTCLANHCNNDVQDAGETSVDCGGECGCRATFEVVALKSIPATAKFAEFKAMSGDGKRLGGTLDRNRLAYPATIAFDGTVTELENYAKGGWVEALSANGNVVTGGLGCSDPPQCTNSTWSVAKWTGSTAPVAVTTTGTVRAISSSGTIVAGDYYDSIANASSGFLINGNAWAVLPQLTYVAGMTPDGKYIAGSLPTGVQAGLVFAQTQAVTKIGSTSWANNTVEDVNGTDPVVVGYGYDNATDTTIGYRWKGGVLTELGFLPGGINTIPQGVSANGSTVVGTTGTNAFQLAFIWTDQDKMRTVVDELEDRGVEPPVDLTLRYAGFISDDGKTIVGSELTQPPTFWRVILE
jgi:hypothetical protein